MSARASGAATAEGLDLTQLPQALGIAAAVGTGLIRFHYAPADTVAAAVGTGVVQLPLRVSRSRTVAAATAERNSVGLRAAGSPSARPGRSALALVADTRI